MKFAARLVRQLLDMLGEMRLHPLWQLEALVLFDHPGETAFAALRIDPDHCFITASQIGGIDGQVGNCPVFIIALFLRGKTLLDRILMAAGKSGENEFTTIGMTFGYRQLVAIFNSLDDFINI